MTNTATTPIPAAQLAACHALATAFNHEWANLPLVDLAGLSPEGIAALVEERYPLSRDDRWMRGITAPTIDEGGHINHTTGSGRLEWNIGPDGWVKLYISRPVPGVQGEGVDVLYVDMPPQTWADMGEADPAYWCHAGYEDVRELSPADPRRDIRPLPRHLDALAKAVRALDGVNPNVPGALAWIEAQRPAAERDELSEARDRTWVMGLSSVAAVDAAMEVLQELRRRYSRD